MMWPLLVASSFAGQWTFAGGPAVTGGTTGAESYASIAPFVAANYGTRLWIFESWLGGSASLLRGNDGGTEYATAPLQGEVGVGLGGRAFSAGMYLSAGFGGGGAGLYAQLSFPTDGRIARWGVEARTLSYDGDAGVAVLLRLQPGGRPERKAPAPEAPADGVHHADPYGDPVEALAPAR